MAAWSKEELQKIAKADDLHIAPFRDDGKPTARRRGFGPWPSVTRSKSAPTAAYSRRWYQAALTQKAGRIIAMSRHAPRQKLAREFGATDVLTERGDEAVARIKDLTKGVGADSVLECVGTQESMLRRSALRDPEALSATLAFRTGSNWTARSCSMRTSTFTVARPLSAVSCQN